MDDRELEQRLRVRLHRRFDPAEPSDELYERVAESLQPEPLRRARVPWAILFVAATIVVAVLAIGSRAVPVGPAATPIPRPSTSPVTPWTGLTFEDISASAPAGYINDVVATASGYVAVTDRAVWTSTDGRGWTIVSDAPSIVYVARAPGGLLGAGYQPAPCASDAPRGASCTSISALWRSEDGKAWQRVSFDVFASGSITALAGDGAGAVVAGIVDGVSSIYTTSDDSTWTKATATPELANSYVTCLGVLGARYIGVGYSGAGQSERAAAWFSSADGTSWQPAELSAPAVQDPGLLNPLTGLYVGRAGAEAIGTQGGPPVTTAWWRTADGRTWTWDSSADPLSHTSLAEHGAAGFPTPGDLASDGDRIVVTGIRNGALEVWSSDGEGAWTQAQVLGAAPTDVVRPFVLADGVLIKTASGVVAGTATAGPTERATNSPSVAATPIPTPAPPSGSVPAITGSTWTRLQVSQLSDGPTGATALTAWSGGYVAFGQATEAGPRLARASRDGRSWTAIPPDEFGSASEVIATAAGDGIMAVTVTASGNESLRVSSDGVTWATAGSPPIRTRPGSIAGNPQGLVALANDPQFQVAFTSNGSSWSTVSIPGLAIDSLQVVTAFRGGFVAVGSVRDGTSGATSTTSTATPVAFWSPDGINWTRSTVEDSSGDGFISVAAGRDGLVAVSLQPGMVPGQAHFWTSSDGRSWRRSDADPLGFFTGGAGEGGAAGLFVGDGTRILAYGATRAGQPTEFWTSFDGTNWSQLALTGANASTIARVGDASPWLLRDGVLFTATDGVWYGQASPN